MSSPKWMDNYGKVHMCTYNHAKNGAVGKLTMLASTTRALPGNQAEVTAEVD